MELKKGILGPARAGGRGRSWPASKTAARTALVMAAMRVAMTAAMTLSTIRVLADDDDGPQPLDPTTKHIQLMTWGAIGVVLVVVIAAYGIRYWQLSHMKSSRPPDESD